MKRILGRLTITVALILSGGLSVLFLGLKRFEHLVKGDVEALFAQAAITRKEAVVTEEMLESLPESVRRYLLYTGVVGKPTVNAVRLKQKGAMYLGPKQGWVPLDAEEHYMVEPPGFVWDVTIY